MFIGVPGTVICNYLACKTKTYLLWTFNLNFDRAAVLSVEVPCFNVHAHRKGDISGGEKGGGVARTRALPAACKASRSG